MLRNIWAYENTTDMGLISVIKHFTPMSKPYSAAINLRCSSKRHRKSGGAKR